MRNPVIEWTEDDVLSLPLDENDTFERKGSELLDLTLKHVQEAEVRKELAKQLSAFANMGGGQIIYGITDAGMVDNGGIARTVKGHTKEWLENVIPTLTEFELVGLNVYEIRPKATGSSIAPDKSIDVVDVPDSERAPHQSKCDHKYYVRLGGRSQPAPHRLIEDIRNRARHPLLEIHDLKIITASQEAPKLSTISSVFKLHIGLLFGIFNRGKVRALGTCLRFSSSIAITATRSGSDSTLRQAALGTGLLEFEHPFYPELDGTENCMISVAGVVTSPGVSPGDRWSLMLGGSAVDEVRLFIDVFADDAPMRRHEFSLSRIDPGQKLGRVISEEMQSINAFRLNQGSR